MFKKIKLLIDEFLNTKRAYVQGMYPNFITQKSELKSEIPVFVYHKIRRNEFESHLRYLKHNNYKTISCDQFYNYLFKIKDIPERSVLLTFDDGFEDLYHIVYPLLKEYNFKVVVYLITGWVGKDGMLTWPQIIEMHSSGLFDFQAHSVNHTSMFKNSNIVDFFNPGHLKNQDWNFPVIDTKDKKIPLGYPIFESTSRFSDDKRFFPSNEVVEWYTSFVQKKGDKQFFANKDWHQTLNQHKLEFKNDVKTGHYENDSDQYNSIKWELSQCKKELEEKLQGKVVKHFAFPWFHDGVRTKQILADCGFQTSVIGMSTQNNANNYSVDPFSVVRVSGDFVMSLPGVGRKSFINIMFTKMIRRLFWGATA